MIELLVVLAIVGILIALLLPAVQSAREAGSRAQCMNNMHQLAIACQTYHDDFQTLPPNGNTSFYWAIRDYVEQGLSDGSGAVKTFVCPSRRGPTANYCDYAGAIPFYGQGSYEYTSTQNSTGGYDYSNSYPGAGSFVRTALGDDNPLPIATIVDGTSNTMLLCEKAINPTQYAGFQSAGDQAWNKAGAPSVTLQAVQLISYGGSYPCTWYGPNAVCNYNYVYPTYIPDTSGRVYSWNTKRGGSPYSYGSESIIRDYYLSAYSWYSSSFPTPFGTNHIYGIPPAAFCDGSVRMMKSSYVYFALLGINDGATVPGYYLN
jgi:type II secretory pathway pseudopilin PulG